MSLRSRLLFVIGTVSVAALLAADFATYSSLHAFLYNRVDQTLQQSHGPFETAANRGRLALTCTVDPGSTAAAPGGNGSARPGGTPSGAGGLPGGGPLGAPPPTALTTEFAEVRTVSGAVVSGEECAVYTGKKAYAPSLPAHIQGVPEATDATGSDGSAAAPGAAGGARREPGIYFDAPSSKSDGPEFRVRVSTLADGDLLVLALPLTETASTLSQLELIEAAVTGVAIVVAMAAGWWLVQLGLRPLNDVEATAEAIAAGNLEERVKRADDRTEVGRLGQSINAMLARIESAFRERLASEQRLQASEGRLRQFVGDASHELRTPIAAVSAYAELFDRGASENPQDLARLLHGIRHEAARMEQLVGDLLILARLDEGIRPVHRPVELVGLCAQAVQTATAVGPQWPIEFQAARPLEVLGDPGALRQVVDNLLGNIRAHTPPGTTGRIEVEADDHAMVAVLRVSDDGPGMSRGQISHAFERFYRADPSRSRAHGGAGLGLSIVAGIVEAHGGSVSARSMLGQGTTFEFRLPLDGSGSALPAASPAGPPAGPPVGPTGSARASTGSTATGVATPPAPAPAPAPAQAQAQAPASTPISESGG